MAAPLDPSNDVLDAYQYDAAESTVHDVYNASEIELQNQAIRSMFFTAAQVAGHNDCLTTISRIPEEDRVSRVMAIMNDAIVPTVVSRQSLKREYPGVEASCPAGKRVRSSPEIYGCPGEGGKCTKKKYALWRSKVSYLKHFVEDHVEEYKVGEFLQCLQCKGTESAHHEYPVQGQLLAKHIWEKHLSIQTESETGITALELEDEEEVA